jgi:hypothetical protein
MHHITQEGTWCRSLAGQAHRHRSGHAGRASDRTPLVYHHMRNIGIIGRQCRYTSKEGVVWI